MRVGDIGKVGTNLAYRVGTLEYINDDSLVVRYKNNDREKIKIGKKEKLCLHIDNSYATIIPLFVVP